MFLKKSQLKVTEYGSEKDRNTSDLVMKEHKRILLLQLKHLQCFNSKKNALRETLCSLKFNAIDYYTE